MKRVFGRVEVAFDVLYLLTALLLSLFFFFSTKGGTVRLAGVMGLVLVFGDSFHLIPRILTILREDEVRYRKALGFGKLVTSITMTLFYLFLYQIGLNLYPFDTSWAWILLLGLSALRIVLCLLPQNRWFERYPPTRWSILRNVPFFILGMLVSALYFWNRALYPGFEWMWFAILLSFAFYLPVVLWVNRNPKIGMFMLPKSCVYLWMLFMCYALL